jgi:hypothetical protein
MDKLIVGVLNFFDDQRGKLLSKKNTKMTHCICIREPNNSVAEPDEIGKYTFAVTSFDNKSKRAIVTYADPNRVPRVESLQLLLARVDIQNISLSSPEEFTYYDMIAQQRSKRLLHTKKTTNVFDLSTIGSSFKTGIMNKLSKKSRIPLEKKEEENNSGAHHPGIRDSSNKRVVHVEEFCKWFLPAVQNIFTVSNLISESGTAHPDVSALFPRHEGVQSLPSFMDEPDASWYLNRETPLKVKIPKEHGNNGYFTGTLESLSSNYEEFIYRRDKDTDEDIDSQQMRQKRPTSDDSDGENTIDDKENDDTTDSEEKGKVQEKTFKKHSHVHTLSKWQVVEYGIFELDTIGVNLPNELTKHKDRHHHHLHDHQKQHEQRKEEKQEKQEKQRKQNNKQDKNENERKSPERKVSFDTGEGVHSGGKNLFQRNSSFNIDGETKSSIQSMHSKVAINSGGNHERNVNDLPPKVFSSVPSKSLLISNDHDVTVDILNISSERIGRERTKSALL